MSLWNLIFQTEVIEQRFGTGALPHHDEYASENRDPAQHRQGPLLHTALLLYLGLQIMVIFSTATGVYTHKRLAARS